MTNPSPLRISDAMWRLWIEFKRHESTAKFGGIVAEKPGYHSWRSRLPITDYSVEDVQADRRGSSAIADALDISLPADKMRLYTARLDKAARARDPRLYSSRGPVLREFIGTLDSKNVYCYVLTGGRPLGVGADAGPDPGRDETHLWHIHLSVIRQFGEDWAALDGVLSVLRGESLTAWQARASNEEEDMAVGDDIMRLLEQGLRPPGTAQTSGGGVPVAWIVRVIKEIQTEQTAQRLRDEAILAAIGNAADVDIQQVLDLVNTRADELNTRVDQVDENVVAALPGRTNGDIVRLLTELLGEDRAEQVARLILGVQPT